MSIVPRTTPNQRMVLAFVGVALTVFGVVVLPVLGSWALLFSAAGVGSSALATFLPRKSQRHWPRKPDLFDENVE